MANKNHESYNIALCKCQTASEAVRHLYYATKAAQPRFSLTLLSKKTGIKSTGYLSDLMRGKKRLNLDTALQLVEAFDLSPEQKRLFKLLAELESTDPAEDKYESIAAAIRVVKKTLRVQLATASDTLPDLLISLELYSYVTMHKDGVRYQEIRDYFKSVPTRLLDPALGDLITTRLISQTSGVYKSTGESFMFADSESGKSHLDFLRATFQRAVDDVEYWFGRKEQSCLLGSLITTNRESYLKRLPEFKRQLLEMQNDIDSEDADMILRFNVQIVPASPES